MQYINETNSKLHECIHSYDHRLYFSINTQDRSATVLAKQLETLGLPAIKIASFGFDFIGITDFIDGDSHKPVIRIAMPDLPEQDIQSAAEIITRWL